jgi:hypothetical protein
LEQKEKAAMRLIRKGMKVKDFKTILGEDGTSCKMGADESPCVWYEFPKGKIVLFIKEPLPEKWRENGQFNGWLMTFEEPPWNPNDQQVYFPELSLAPKVDEVFEPREKSHEFYAKWYGKHLYAMKEPSLWESRNEKGGTSYRLLYLRTFHEPICVRVILEAEEGFLFVKKTNGKGGYEPGSISIKRSLVLTKKEINQIFSLFKELSFWKMSSSLIDGGLDGSEWILEVSGNGKYHVVSRSSPKSHVADWRLEMLQELNANEDISRLNETNVSLVALCEYLLKLSGLNLEKDDIY